MAGRPLHERLTVVITTSPVPSNPSTAMIEALLTSFNLCTGLVMTHLLHCDGRSDPETSPAQWHAYSLNPTQPAHPARPPAEKLLYATAATLGARQSTAEDR